MQRSRAGSLAAAAVLVTAAVLLISSADGAALSRQSRDVRWSRPGYLSARPMPKCSLGGICGFRVFGAGYDDSDFVQTCHCAWSCEEDYFNLATRVGKFRCKE